VSIHGNEPCGVDAVNELIEEGWFNALPPSCVTLEILLGNPLAYSKGKRFMAKNLNRIINPACWESLDSDRKEGIGRELHYEFERAKVVSQSIELADEVLDIHSCSAPSPSFALPAENSKSQGLAESLPVDVVVNKLAHITIERGTTMDYVLKLNKIGVCVECGQHLDPVVKSRAKSIIQAFVLHGIPIPPKSIGFPSRCQKLVMDSTHSVAVGNNFRFNRSFKQFSFVKYGEIICQDDNGIVTCPYLEGAYIVMPTQLPFVGEEAFYWGRDADSYPPSKDSREFDIADLCKRFEAFSNGQSKTSFSHGLVKLSETKKMNNNSRRNSSPHMLVPIRTDFVSGPRSSRRRASLDMLVPLSRSISTS